MTAMRLAGMVVAALALASCGQEKPNAGDLFQSVVANNVAGFRSLIAKGADPRSLNGFRDHGRAALDLAQSAEMARLLVDQGVDPNQRDDNGLTPLMVAFL